MDYLINGFSVIAFAVSVIVDTTQLDELRSMKSPIKDDIFHTSLFVILTLVSAAPFTYYLATKGTFKDNFSFIQLHNRIKFWVSMIAWILYSFALLSGYTFICIASKNKGVIPFKGLLTGVAIAGCSAQFLMSWACDSDRIKTALSTTRSGSINVVLFATICLNIMPMIFLSISGSFALFCSNSDSCLFRSSPFNQIGTVFSFIDEPSTFLYTMAMLAISLSAPITFIFAGKIDEPINQKYSALFGGPLWLHVLTWISYLVGSIFLFAFLFSAVFSTNIDLNEFDFFQYYNMEYSSLAMIICSAVGFGMSQILMIATLPVYRSLSKGSSYNDKDIVSTASGKMWGRAYVGNWGTALMAVGMMASTPFLVIFFWVTIASFDGSITDSLLALYNTNFTLNSLTVFEWWTTSNVLPQPTLSGLKIISIWLSFQVVLALVLPGKTASGQLTPAGNILDYNVNGMQAWIVTAISFALLSLPQFGIELFAPTIVFDHHGSLLIWANVLGFFLTGFVYLKANIFPTHPKDCKWSGSFAYDMFMGIELNPRIGNFDFKLFFNGRPGIIGWSIINASLAAAQYAKWGYVSNSMLAVNVLHNVYILDFFYNEAWYLKTIDIAHDHMGFYLAWGDTVWLPFMYTLQCQYLVYQPVQHSNITMASVYLLGFLGYFIFRSANNQRYHFRDVKGKCDIWGKPATFIRATFQQADGKVRESLLLTSGWWGLSRHFNYVGDLMMSLSFCACCGVKNILPYFYIIYMLILLVNRLYRDDQRCSGKYGHYWDQYCQAVPWFLIPGIY